MRVTLRLILSIVASVMIVVTLFTFLQAKREKSALLEEMERRSAVIVDSLEENVQSLVESSHKTELNRLVGKFQDRERLLGLAVYGSNGDAIVSAKRINAFLPDPPSEIKDAAASRTVITFYRPGPPGA